MSLGGFVVLHRKVLEWEWFDDTNTFKVFVYMLLKANHEPKKWRGITVERGQLVTGRKALADATNLSEQQVRTALKNLQSTSEITIKPTNKYSLITIENYSFYQDKKINQPAKQPTKHQPSNQQSTTNNNYNNINNKSRTAKAFQKPTLDEIRNYISERGYSVNPLKFFNHYESNGWKVGKNAMKDWKAAIVSWQTREETTKPKPKQPDLRRFGPDGRMIVDEQGRRIS